MESVKQFLSYMNEVSFLYVVMRNFENLPHSVKTGKHSDLDLLVYDIEHWMEIFPQAERVAPHPRVRFKMPIADTFIYIDVRYMGDGYYPQDFEKGMLEARQWCLKGFYVPNPMMFRLGLVYHAVHHKGENTYQRWIGDGTLDEMFQALKMSKIGWEEPEDPSVGSYNAYWKGATAVVEKTGDIVTKRQNNFLKYDLLGNEYRVLLRAIGNHFPKVYSHSNGDLFMENCGDSLTADNLPDNWRAQLSQILMDLKVCKIQHRDIKPDNLMVKDGVIKLIDFGWARLFDDSEDSPPSCLGYPFRPSWGFDDMFSMKQVAKRLDFIKEGVMV